PSRVVISTAKVSTKSIQTKFFGQKNLVKSTAVRVMCYTAVLYSINFYYKIFFGLLKKSTK
ncbi:MAG: hypothetical protein SPJ71_07870, partial [Candidatus Limisoma sp.]|nr:hypothetical protein [Bacteroidales bacterium]MDY5894464.1 hypothetical protein [Candidatus Limisoma sp.]